MRYGAPAVLAAQLRMPEPGHSGPPASFSAKNPIGANKSVAVEGFSITEATTWIMPSPSKEW